MWPGFTIDQVTEWSVHIEPWARNILIDKLELSTKCGIEFKHQLGLVYQLW